MRSSPSGRTIPNEVVRYYFRIDDTTTPATTVSPRPWSAADTTLAPTNPPTVPDFNFILPVPPCKLCSASLVVLRNTLGGAITGDPIALQWRAILGSNPAIIIPAPAIGAPVPSFIDPEDSSLVALGNFNFEDVVIPQGGGVIFPDLSVPANLVIPAGSSLECFFSQGIDWDDRLIREPFGP